MEFTVQCQKNAPPDFWISPAVSQEPLKRSKPDFQGTFLQYSMVHIVNFIEIRQDLGFVPCLRTQRIYSALYCSVFDGGNDGDYIINNNAGFMDTS